MNQRHPQFAVAQVRGGPDYPQLHGTVRFRQTRAGTLVTATIFNLPDDGEEGSNFFAFHIHEGSRCAGNPQDPFAEAGPHYNPTNAPHPRHAGDLPPLLGNHGYAYLSVLTGRFAVEDVVGRVVIIHRGLDDFTTQPSGNAGAKIACGKILAR